MKTVDRANPTHQQTEAKTRVWPHKAKVSTRRPPTGPHFPSQYCHAMCPGGCHINCAPQGCAHAPLAPAAIGMNARRQGPSYLRYGKIPRSGTLTGSFPLGPFRPCSPSRKRVIRRGLSEAQPRELEGGGAQAFEQPACPAGCLGPSLPSGVPLQLVQPLVKGNEVP